MALALLRAPHVALPPPLLPLLPLLLLLLPLLSAGALEMIDGDAPELSCSEEKGSSWNLLDLRVLQNRGVRTSSYQEKATGTLISKNAASTHAKHLKSSFSTVTTQEGLTDCQVSADCLFAAALPDPDDAWHVTHVQLQAMLRRSAAQECEPNLQIAIKVQDVNDTRESSEGSGDHNDEDELVGINQMSDGSDLFVPSEPRALVKVCISSPGAIECCRTIQFKSSSPGLDPASTHELVLIQKATFGSSVVVLVYSHSDEMDIRNITIPSLKEVCSMNLQGTEKKCDAPRLRAVMDHQRDAALLQMENPDEPKCRMVWKETGEVLAWPEGKREMVLPSHFIVPCLCLQVRCEGMELQSEFCPFKDQQDVLERMQHNVTVTLGESLTRGGTALTWSVTAPCRLEAEVRLCKGEAAGGRCEEVMGSRQRLHGGWSSQGSKHQKTGEFNVSSHPLLCVQIKLNGMESFLEPQCPFSTSRWRWSLPFLIGLILTCLAVLGAYLIQGVLKGYMWRWLKEDDVKGAVGGGHVMLLYPPGDDQALPELMSHLGSSLQALGFSVSLDLWSQAELSALGPVPWLHSRLNRLQQQGGKVVLVLTQAAWIKAEEWGARSWERNSPVEEEAWARSASSPCGDVFTASLSCILADYLQGRAGERFMLAQLEALPPEPPGGFRPLPELFRGLHVYSLPSQSLGFLTELAGARQMATASARRKRAGGLRMASRALARRLSEFTVGTTVLRLPGVSQGCVGAGGRDSGESVPLQARLITPPSSPDSSHKVSDVEWL